MTLAFNKQKMTPKFEQVKMMTPYILRQKKNSPLSLLHDWLFCTRVNNIN